MTFLRPVSRPLTPGRPQPLRYLSLLGITATLALATISISGCDDKDDDDKGDGGDGGDDGDGNDSGDECGGNALCETGGSGCVENEVTLTLDEATDLGFSAADLLAVVAGSHEDTLTWSDTELTGVGDATTTITYALDTQNPTKVVLIESEPDPSSDIEIDAECDDRMAITTGATVSSADGLLDESLEVVITSTDGQAVSWYGGVAPADFGGTFPETSADGDMEVTALDFSGQHDGTMGDRGGSVSAELQSVGDGPDGIAAYGTVGYWGDYAPGL